MQVAQGVGVPGAVGALVEAHGPATHPLGGLADPVGGLADIRFGQPGEGGDAVGRIVLKKARHGLPTFGECGDEGRIGMAVFHQQVQQAIEQGEVGAGLDRQVQIGLVGGGAASGVDHDQLRPGLDPVHHAQEQNRMTVGHIGADHEEQVGAVKVFVGTRWSVRAQG